MERRLLIAFLLSTALIMAYNFFYYGPRLREQQKLRKAQQERLAEEQARAEQLALEEQPEPVPETDTPSEKKEDFWAAADTTATPEPTLDEPDALPGGTENNETHVTVTTPLLEVVLSSEGARVEKVVLFEYKTNGNPVQLIREGDDGALGTRLIGENRSLPLSGAEFDAYVEGASTPLYDGATLRLDETSKPKTVVFRSVAPDGRRVERYYQFEPSSYVVRTGIRYTEANFPFVKHVEWDFGPGLQPTEQNVRDDQDAMRATLRLGDEIHKKKHGDFSEDFSGVVQWAALKTKYFIAVMVPDEPSGGEAHLAGVKDERYLTAAISLPTGAQRGAVDQGIDVYFGPQDYDVLKSMGRGIEKNIDIGFEHFKIFKPVSHAILWSMVMLHKVVPNYGLVIILISVLTKVLFYRLTHKSFKSMRDMQALQPKLQALKEKYKDDRQRLSQETMKVYKESGVNPLGGCLPMLLQMPVFIALFNVLRNTIEIRRAPFFGWMDDLSQQDVLATLPFSLPVIGNAVSVLPILMGASMLLQSKIGGSIAGPSSTTSQPKALTYMLPIVFTVLFYKMPSGLVLYWLVNTVMSVGQQYYINKGADREEQAAREAEAKNETKTKPPVRNTGKATGKPARRPRSKRK